MFERRRRGARGPLELAFEVLEDRTLLAASPMLAAAGGLGFGHTERPTADHDLRVEVARSPLGHHDARRHSTDDGNGAMPHRIAHTAMPGGLAPPPLLDRAAPSLPLLPVGAPPVASNLSGTPILTDRFIAPHAIDEIPSLTRIIDVESSPTVQSVDVVDSVFQTDPLAGGAFAAEFELYRNFLDSSASALNSVDSSVSFADWAQSEDADAHSLFAALADSDLPVDRLTFLDDILVTNREAAIRRLQSSSSTDANFESYASDDGPYRELARAAKAKPFRRGFVDIGESVDELFSEHSATRQEEAGDSLDPQEDSPADVIVEHDEGDRISLADSWRAHQARRLAAQAASNAQASTREPSNPPVARGGMVQLAHTGNALAEGNPDQVREADPLNDPAPTFLKMDGAIVRYQAFQVAPLSAADDSASLRSTDRDVDEQSPTEGHSAAVSDHSSHPPERVWLVPAILGFLWHHRTRRRDTQSS